MFVVYLYLLINAGNDPTNAFFRNPKMRLKDTEKMKF